MHCINAKNPQDMDVHNSLTNVAIHIPCVNIYRAEQYQLAIFFTHARIPPIAMVLIYCTSLTAFSCPLLLYVYTCM